MATASVMDEEVRSAPARILVVEDHPLVLERVIALLRPSFDVVGTACNGREMIAEAMRLNPDVIVTDISMPEMDGIAAVRQVRAEGCRAKLVILTIYASSEFVGACLAAGGLGYVLKAQMHTDLIPAINAALSGRSFVSFWKTGGTGD